jgi:hypothetical protein
VKVTIEFDPIAEPVIGRKFMQLFALDSVSGAQGAVKVGSQADVVAARAAFEAAAEAAPAEQNTQPAAAEPAKRRGRPPKNAEAATVIAAPIQTPAGTTQPAAASDAATAPTVAVEASLQPAQPAAEPTGSPTQAPTDVLEFIYNRDGAATAIACLQRFGVARLKDLKPDQVAPFVGYCQEVIAGSQNPISGAAA